MGVEAAVRKAGILHDIGDTGAAVAAAPDSARGGVDDPFVRGVLASGGGLSHGSLACMMLIIYQAREECKRNKKQPRMNCAVGVRLVRRDRYAGVLCARTARGSSSCLRRRADDDSERLVAPEMSATEFRILRPGISRLLKPVTRHAPSSTAARRRASRGGTDSARTSRGTHRRCGRWRRRRPVRTRPPSSCPRR